MKLTPVIEFGPELFRKESRDYPSIKLEKEAYQKARKGFWYDMLADWGITDLKPYVEGSEFVSLTDINDQTLEILIDRELAMSGSTTDIDFDEVSTIAGGFVFETASHVIVPSCCGDLSNYYDWEELARSPIGDVKEVWIGHPWFTVEGVDHEKIRLYMQCEHSSKTLHDLVIRQAELNKSLEKTRQELLAFQNKVKAELSRRSYPSELAYELIGWKDRAS